MKVSVKTEYRRKKKDDFQRQMFGIACADAKMQRSNLMLTLHERNETKTMIEPVFVSFSKNELLSEKRLLICCLFENLHIQNSENPQQKLWIKNLKVFLEITEKMSQS